MAEVIEAGTTTPVETVAPKVDAPAEPPKETAATGAAPQVPGYDEVDKEYGDGLTPAQKREITIARNQKRAADAERDEARRQLAAMSQALAQRTEPAQSTFNKPEPKPEQFADDDAFRNAHSQWRGEKIAADTIAEERRRDREAREQQEAANARIRYAGSIESARAKYADWEAVAQSPQLFISEGLAKEVVSSAQPADVQYWLGKHPDEARRISQLPQAQIAREVARIEGRIEALSSLPAPKPAVSKAPEPVKPVGTSAVVEPNLYEMNANQVYDQLTRQRANRRR